MNTKFYGKHITTKNSLVESNDAYSTLDFTLADEGMETDHEEKQKGTKTIEAKSNQTNRQGHVSGLPLNRKKSTKLDHPVGYDVNPLKSNKLETSTQKKIVSEQIVERNPCKKAEEFSAESSSDNILTVERGQDQGMNINVLNDNLFDEDLPLSTRLIRRSNSSKTQREVIPSSSLSMSNSSLEEPEFKTGSEMTAGSSSQHGKENMKLESRSKQSMHLPSFNQERENFPLNSQHVSEKGQLVGDHGSEKSMHQIPLIVQHLQANDYIEGQQQVKEVPNQKRPYHATKRNRQQGLSFQNLIPPVQDNVIKEEENIENTMNYSQKDCIEDANRALETGSINSEKSDNNMGRTRDDTNKEVDDVTRQDQEIAKSRNGPSTAALNTEKAVVDAEKVGNISFDDVEKNVEKFLNGSDIFTTEPMVIETMKSSEETNAGFKGQKACNGIAESMINWKKGTASMHINSRLDFEPDSVNVNLSEFSGSIDKSALVLASEQVVAKKCINADSNNKSKTNVFSETAETIETAGEDVAQSITEKGSGPDTVNTLRIITTGRENEIDYEEMCINAVKQLAGSAGASVKDVHQLLTRSGIRLHKPIVSLCLSSAAVSGKLEQVEAGGSSYYKTGLGSEHSKSDSEHGSGPAGRRNKSPRRSESLLSTSKMDKNGCSSLLNVRSMPTDISKKTVLTEETRPNPEIILGEPLSLKQEHLPEIVKPLGKVCGPNKEKDHIIKRKEGMETTMPTNPSCPVCFR